MTTQSDCEPVSASNSLLTGKITGNFADLAPYPDIGASSASEFKGLEQDSLDKGTGNYFHGAGNYSEETRNLAAENSDYGGALLRRGFEYMGRKQCPL